MTPSVSFIPQQPLSLPSKPVVTSSKKMSTWDRAVDWLNSPRGFEKATRMATATLTIAVAAGALYYLNPSNFFGSTEQPPFDSSEGPNYCYSDNLFGSGSCLEDNSIQYGPEGYYCGGKICTALPSPNSQASSDQTQINPGENSFSNSESSFDYAAFFNQILIPPTCSVKYANQTTPVLKQNIAEQTANPLLEKGPFKLTTSGNGTNQSNSANQTTLVLQESIIELHKQEEIFEPSKFCQATNSTSVQALCEGILSGRVVFANPDDTSAFPDLRKALDYIYQSSNSRQHNILCNATDQFWKVDNVIHLGSSTNSAKIPISLLLDKDKTLGGPADFFDMLQTHKNKCSLIA